MLLGISNCFIYAFYFADRVVQSICSLGSRESTDHHGAIHANVPIYLPHFHTFLQSMILRPSLSVSFTDGYDPPVIISVISCVLLPARELLMMV